MDIARNRTSSQIFWHGTPHAFDPADIKRSNSFIDGVFLTGSLEVAAIYAGPSGTVHGYLIEPCRLIDASGHGKSGEPMHYPSASTWEWIRQWIDAQGSDIEEFDCIDPFKLEAGFVEPLGPEGQPSWEEIFEDLLETDDGHVLIEALDCAGIVIREWNDLAVGDRSANLEGSMASSWKALRQRLKKDGDAPHLVVAAIDPTVLKHVCTVPADSIAAGVLAMPPTTLSALEGCLVSPDQEPAAVLAFG